MGPGLAYFTNSPGHLLNVPVGGMSAFPDDPQHFLRWIRRLEPGTGPREFVPRRRYGRYLEALLREAREEAAPGVHLELLRAEAVSISISQEREGIQVVLAEGGALAARTAVLAVGNALPADLPVEDGGLYASPRYIRSPWSRGALRRIRPHEPVLLVGTGLTMVDTVLSLAERGHQGPLHALSRHGLLPHVHRPVPARTAVALPETLRTRSLLRALRREVREAGEGTDWRSVVDALRPRTVSLWRDLPLPERRRFLRHLRSFWEVHRHRMAPQVGGTLERLQRAGVLRVHAARVRGFRLTGSGVEARVLPRGLGREDSLRVRYVINCTGPDCALSRAHPLLRGLLEAGLARVDALGLGLATDAGGALLDARGRPSRALFTLGPLRRGELWETTAIPEIRMQALALARRLLEALASRPEAPDVDSLLAPPFSQAVPLP